MSRVKETNPSGGLEPGAPHTLNHACFTSLNGTTERPTHEGGSTLATHCLTTADALAIPNVNGKRPRLIAPDDLSDAARRVWDELVDSLDSDHFAPSDAPLLRSYSRRPRWRTEPRPT